MIIKQLYGGGERYYCDNCDVHHDGHLTKITWTNSKAPLNCPHCNELVCLVIRDSGRVSFVSIVMKRSEAMLLQRTLHEGYCVTPEIGRELKRGMTNPSMACTPRF